MVCPGAMPSTSMIVSGRVPQNIDLVPMYDVLSEWQQRCHGHRIYIYIYPEESIQEQCRPFNLHINVDLKDPKDTQRSFFGRPIELSPTTRGARVRVLFRPGCAGAPHALLGQ